MKRKGVTLEDLADSISDLGAMMSAQITGLCGEVDNLRIEMKSEISGIKLEIGEMHHDIRDIQIVQRDHGQRLGSLESEMQATRSDIKELYKLTLA